MDSSRRSIQSAQELPDLWALCAQRMGNKCPSLGLSMPIPWSVDAHSLVPDCPLDGQDRQQLFLYSYMTFPRNHQSFLGKLFFLVFKQVYHFLHIRQSLA